MTAGQKKSDVCFSYRLEGTLDPLKDNLGNSHDYDNANEIIIAPHSDLGWFMVAACFTQAQPFSVHCFSTADHHSICIHSQSCQATSYL